MFWSKEVISWPRSRLKRKLAAILSADVKGYSRLMGEDEEWTLRTLNTYKGLIRNLVEEHRGRVVGSPGDNILAEFASVVNAVECAVEIQQVLRAKNALLPETRQMEFRIGINLGDVIEEGDSIYGDGVNIAARLESLAEPGGSAYRGPPTTTSKIRYRFITISWGNMRLKILPSQFEYIGQSSRTRSQIPQTVCRQKILLEGIT